ncbi:CRISPR-associated helicase Cas3' [Runella sp.]|uniref:CRISPR-associated helicase Cas3' n=1 Tax=Runella sp. TaxID=1960881 RepID=UPI0030165F9A
MLSIKLAQAFRVTNLLEHADKYLAHLPRKGTENTSSPETLGEHMELVLAKVVEICEKNGLESIINNLIVESVDKITFDQADFAADYMLELFADTIAFHDFGKVNEYFQVDRMKNTDPLFKQKGPEIFSPKHGHSELGAYLFCIYHLEKINAFDTIGDDDKVKLSVLVFFFCNSILLHHNPTLVNPHERVLRSQFLQFRTEIKKFIWLYQGFPEPDIANDYLDALKEIFNQFESPTDNFPLFALLRLNFSLLTAADYLATGEYSYDLKLETDQHWGILSGEKRERLLEATRSNKEKPYNIDAYTKLEQLKSGAYQFINPKERSGPNLNVLRTEMAVKVLQTIENHTDKRLFYLEAPTGGGKTNLSMLAVTELLRADPSLKKVFYVFPFTTLITQTHKVIKETLCIGDDDIALLHSKAGFQTNVKENEALEDGLYGSNRLDFLQNLFALYPVTLVTHVRFFDILKSNRKDDIYLMHRLANSVVVLDELQSYPPKQWDKMLYMLDQYGKYFNIRFILMSATLPKLTEIKAVQIASGGLSEVIDLLPNAHKYFQNENFKGRVSFKFDLLQNGNEDITLEELASVLLEKSRARAAVSEGRVFTIVEFIFKKSATEFRAVIDQLEQKDSFFGEHIYVLSGTILESRRRNIINLLKRNRKTPGMKVLLITTQVVEAGVDIDMDLGFKNVSLIDSDEQLAGRVNRNVDKEDCEVYLFRKDDPMVLYKSDDRYKITRDLNPEFHREILESKDFGKLYNLVFEKIDVRNNSSMLENFKDNYLGYFKKLDFPKIKSEFKIIDQQTLSVFVPLELPLTIENLEGEQEPFFNDFELRFLRQEKVFQPGDQTINGAEVWKLFRKILSNAKDDFIAKKIEQKTLQGILAKFTFSIFSSPKICEKLKPWTEPDNLDDYVCLNDRFSTIYDYESGLMEYKLDDPECRIF